MATPQGLMLLLVGLLALSLVDGNDIDLSVAASSSTSGSSDRVVTEYYFLQQYEPPYKKGRFLQDPPSAQCTKNAQCNRQQDCEPRSMSEQCSYGYCETAPGAKTGDCRCRRGYYGEFCEKGPCEYGTPKFEGDQWECDCIVGYYGSECSYPCCDTKNYPFVQRNDLATVFSEDDPFKWNNWYCKDRGLSSCLLSNRTFPHCDKVNGDWKCQLDRFYEGDWFDVASAEPDKRMPNGFYKTTNATTCLWPMYGCIWWTGDNPSQMHASCAYTEEDCAEGNFLWLEPSLNGTFYKTHSRKVWLGNGWSKAIKLYYQNPLEVNPKTQTPLEPKCVSAPSSLHCSYEGVAHNVGVSGRAPCATLLVVAVLSFLLLA